MAVHSGLCQTWSETPKTGFLTSGSSDGEEVLIKICNICDIVRESLPKNFQEAYGSCPKPSDKGWLETSTYRLVLVIRTPQEERLFYQLGQEGHQNFLVDLITAEKIQNKHHHNKN